MGKIVLRVCHIPVFNSIVSKYHAGLKDFCFGQEGQELKKILATSTLWIRTNVAEDYEEKVDENHGFFRKSPG